MLRKALGKLMKAPGKPSVWQSFRHDQDGRPDEQIHVANHDNHCLSIDARPAKRINRNAADRHRSAE